MLIRKGLFRMRNGQTAQVVQQIKLPYSANSPQHILVWKGRCVQDDSQMTWNLDGSYAAVPSKNPYDIMSKIAKTGLPR